MPDGERIKHPSFGLVGISRISSSREETLFGSSIGHSNIISLQISRATKERNLNRDWFSPEEELIEVWLSPSQFADLITTPNIGSGVPCTIRHINCVTQPDCPEVKIRKVFEQEFKKDIETVTANANDLINDVKTLFDPKRTKTLRVKEKQEIVEKLRMLAQELQSNLPFVQSQFNETMDKTVQEAKGEIEASISQKIQSIGLQGLRTQIAGMYIEGGPLSQKQLPGGGESNPDEEDNH